MFSSVSVGLSLGLYKIYRIDFHETWIEDGPKTDPTNFCLIWCNVSIRIHLKPSSLIFIQTILSISNPASFTSMFTGLHSSLSLNLLPHRCIFFLRQISGIAWNHWQGLYVSWQLCAIDTHSCQQDCFHFFPKEYTKAQSSKCEYTMWWTKTQVNSIKIQSAD